MAEVLVRATDAPVPDSPGKWLAGMGAVVMPDGWTWGSKEGPPTFVVLKFPKISVADLKERVEAVKEDDGVVVSRRMEGVVQSEIDDALANGGVKEYPNLKIQRLDARLKNF